MHTQIAADLVAWTRLLALTGDVQVLAACEPKAMRYRFLHVPARLTLGARRRRMRVPESLALGSRDRRDARRHSQPA
ncbi:hypothetical protein [Pseudonocardia hierapolitana]|uniref:hypothetical protein n=1 Tax=Pseudonocardia hierapolitana TaxID=1128676 RepID=UPI001FE66621|nr:hypothetical protein [Pseudonocardia hierapolitana]